MSTPVGDLYPEQWKPLLFLFVTVPFLLTCGTAGPSKNKQQAKNPLHIHMISGSKEYKSARSLPRWKKRLEKQYHVRCTMSMGADHAKKIGGLKHLSDADLLVLFNRRFELEKKYWKPIRSYLKSGRPVLGIRTASHAFDRNFPKVDVKLLGADYHGHGSNENVAVSVKNEHRDHPILEGIDGWKRRGKLYRNRNFAPSTKVLLIGRGSRLNEPVAWINNRDGQRIFYTSMGFPHDFENETFLRLLQNAVEWTTGRTLKSKSTNK